MYETLRSARGDDAHGGFTQEIFIRKLLHFLDASELRRIECSLHGLRTDTSRRGLGGHDTSPARAPMSVLACGLLQPCPAEDWSEESEKTDKKRSEMGVRGETSISDGLLRSQWPQLIPAIVHAIQILEYYVSLLLAEVSEGPLRVNRM